MSGSPQVSPPPLARLTVVVPVGPGDSISNALLTDLARLPPDAELYLVFADAADSARLPSLPQPADGPERRSLVAAAGRARQQNAGAAAGTREWLCFLHADSKLTSATLPALAKFVQRDTAALGYFDLRYLEDGPWMMRFNALGAGIRSRLLRLPFGDQGLVLPRAVFQRIGGFDSMLSRGEDHELIWRLRRAGVPLCAIGAPLYTSARRYAESGWSATTRATLVETWRQARRFSRTSAAR